MTFFETQRQAKRNTKLLVFYFAGAVIFIILAIYCSFTLILLEAQSGSEQKLLSSFWNPEFFVGVSVSVLSLVSLGSLFKIWMLRGGGEVVATSLGGRLLNPATNDPHERKVLNIVEEISIASGVPVPPVYIMDDELSINAFAAGYTPESAVIGVTNGCIKILSRDELQGVIAHEFSHILNGDMRLNIRLIGVVHGILILGLIGYWILRTSMSGRRRSSNRDDGKSRGGLALFGLALYVIGYAGVLFGNLIKAAVSREREYLADASAVQFTRNPEGIASALKKIGGLQYGSTIENSHAQEASHMFFANGLTASWFKFFATHPPLTQRIQKVDKSFDGVFPVVEFTTESEETEALPEEQESKGPLDPLLDIIPGVGRATAAFAVSPGTVMASIGNPQAEHLDYAKSLIRQIPQKVKDNVHDPHGARAIVYVLLLDTIDKVKALQLQTLKRNESDELLTLIDLLSKEPVLKDDRFRLPLIDLCLPSLKQLSNEQYQHFKSVLNQLVSADKEVSLFEYALHHILIRNCEQAKSPAKSKHSPLQYFQASGELLWCLAYSGHSSTMEREAAYDRAIETIDYTTKPKISNATPALEQLDSVLGILSYAPLPLKESLIQACILCSATDNTITVAEAEILRVVCDALHCPVPPFLPGQAV